jgi:2-oxoglutarate ferredoxin oxidoreductase subunit alpha
VVNSLHLQPEDLERCNIERFERYTTVKAKEQRAETHLVEDAEIVVVAFGACARIARSAVGKAREKGIRVGLIRPVTLWPYPVDAIEASVAGAKAYLTVEMNMGQMVDDVRLAVNGRRPVEFFGHAGGIIPTPSEVLGEIERMAAEQEGGAR